MGIFSFKRAEDGKSIPTIHSGLPMKTHYLIQPGGKPPIAEPAYNGYGYWGDTHLHTWLAETNAESLGLSLEGLDEEQIRQLGVTLDRGEVFQDTRDGKLWWIGKWSAVPALGGEVHEGNFADFNDRLNGIPNHLIDQGTLTSVPVKEAFNLAYPIKLSAYPEAKYEDLPPSGLCEYQGLMYPLQDAQRMSEITDFDKSFFEELEAARQIETDNLELMDDLGEGDTLSMR